MLLTDAMTRRSRANIKRRNLLRKLEYPPEKQSRFDKSIRKKLSSKNCYKLCESGEAEEMLKIGAINLRGLDHEAHWAISEIMKEHKLDVCVFYNSFFN